MKVEDLFHIIALSTIVGLLLSLAIYYTYVSIVPYTITIYYTNGTYKVIKNVHYYKYVDNYILCLDKSTISLHTNMTCIRLDNVKYVRILR